MAESDVVDVERLTDVDFLRHQLEIDASAFAARFKGLTTGLCDVVENYGLLNFTALAVEQPESVAQVMDLVDRANGFNLSGLKGHNPYPEEASEARTRLQEYLAAGPRDIWAGDEGKADLQGQAE
jgi:hypothetical protein